MGWRETQGGRLHPAESLPEHRPVVYGMVVWRRIRLGRIGVLIMYKTFVALAYLRHSSESPVEIGYASSYGRASELVREWASNPLHVRDIAYFRIEGRYYV